MGLIGSYKNIKKIINYHKRVKYIKQIKKEKNIDVAISFLETTNFVNILSRQNEKVIISVRNYVSKLASGVYGFLYKNMIKILYNKADLVVSVSKAIAFDLVNKYKIKQHKIKVVYNPYNIAMIQMNASYPLEKEIARNCYIHGMITLRVVTSNLQQVLINLPILMEALELCHVVLLKTQ